MTSKTSNHSPKIIFLIDSLGVGGAERLLVTYLACLQTMGFSVRVCTFGVRQGNPIADDIRKLGVEVDFLRIPLLRDISAIPRLMRYLRQQGAALVHTQLEFADSWGTVAARLLGLPTVSTQHTLEDPQKGTKAYRRLKVHRWVLRNLATKIIAVSEETRNHYLRVARFSPNQIVTLYNGIDLSRFSPATMEKRKAFRAALGIGADAPLITTVAVLRPAKGIQYMLEAMPTILQAMPTARYMIVGDGEYRVFLREITQQNNLENNVTFTGVRSDVPDLLGVSDLFVLPTLDDALPTVLAEAMASKLPIVASRVGGIPEMVTDGLNGLLVAPQDSVALAAACQKILASPELTQYLASNGHQVACERYDIRKQAHQLGELYRQLLTPGQGANL